MGGRRSATEAAKDRPHISRSEGGIELNHTADELRTAAGDDDSTTPRSGSLFGFEAATRRLRGGDEAPDSPGAGGGDKRVVVFDDPYNRHRYQPKFYAGGRRRRSRMDDVCVAGRRLLAIGTGFPSADRLGLQAIVE